MSHMVMTRLRVVQHKEILVEAVEEFDIDDLWDYTLAELMEDAEFEWVDDNGVVYRKVEVVET